MKLMNASFDIPYFTYYIGSLVYTLLCVATEKQRQNNTIQKYRSISFNLNGASIYISFRYIYMFGDIL